MTCEITDSQTVWQFFNERLGLHPSGDFRGVCHFAPDTLQCAPLTMEAVTVAIGFNAFIGRTCSMHLVVQKPEAFSARVIREAFEFAFHKCGCEAALALVDSENKASLDIVGRIGFEEIARVKHGATDGDLVILEMRRDSCRWLRQH